MPRKYIPLNSADPYHISARCINREWFELPLDDVWSIMEDYLYLIDKIFEVRLHSFVLMSNHFHLLMTAPQGNMSQAMLYFMRETSREITRLTGRINQTYGGRYHKSRIGNFHSFMNAYKYVYRNPVRAKTCDKVEAYPYSTLHGLCGLKRLIIPVVEDVLLFTPSFEEATLRWLNTPPPREAEEEIRKALRRPKFELCTNRSTGRASELETELL